MALAPRLALLGVPSSSSIVWSTRRWSSAVMPSIAGAIVWITALTALPTPLPPQRSPPSRSSTASKAPVEAPLGTAARPNAPSSSSTSTSTVGLPRESRISRAPTAAMIDMAELLRGDVSGSAASLATSYADVAGVSAPTASVRGVPLPEPGPADHLRVYVERAAAAADDRAADPDATRLRLAMAGESPARFRDRLVLERAAWLARATDRPLRDIAAECGFRGYDVFVR